MTYLAAHGGAVCRERVRPRRVAVRVDRFVGFPRLGSAPATSLSGRFRRGTMEVSGGRFGSRGAYDPSIVRSRIARDDCRCGRGSEPA
jgi:hypothetical protein